MLEEIINWKLKYLEKFWGYGDYGVCMGGEWNGGRREMRRKKYLLLDLEIGFNVLDLGFSIYIDMRCGFGFYKVSS